MPGEKIYSLNEFVDEMYFIEHGLISRTYYGMNEEE